MKILGLMVARNEADRYLSTTLSRAMGLVDGMVVYDDSSTDSTPTLAADLGATVIPNRAVPFAVHEGRFREAAWSSLVNLGVQVGDWVICPDADEYIVADRPLLREAIAIASASGAKAITMNIDEVFGENEEEYLARTDGFWGAITGVRVAQWTGDTAFPDRRLGCGSAPSSCKPLISVEVPRVAHLGYLRWEDRVAKHARYVGRPEHHRAHVESILQHPETRPIPKS